MHVCIFQHSSQPWHCIEFSFTILSNCGVIALPKASNPVLCTSKLKVYALKWFSSLISETICRNQYMFTTFHSGVKLGYAHNLEWCDLIVILFFTGLNLLVNLKCVTVLIIERTILVLWSISVQFTFAIQMLSSYICKHAIGWSVSTKRIWSWVVELYEICCNNKLICIL